MVSEFQGEVHVEPCRWLDEESVTVSHDIPLSKLEADRRSERSRIERDEVHHCESIVSAALFTHLPCSDGGFLRSMTGTCMMKYIMKAKSSFLELSDFAEDMATAFPR